MPSSPLVLRRVRRAVLARRRGLAALCTALAVLAGLRAVAPPPPPTVPVVVAARDLAAGTTLGDDDVTVVQVAARTRPDGTSGTTATSRGRVLAAPLRRGEPVTDVRLVGPGLLRGYPGLVAAPVRVADAAAVGLLRVGDRVDLVAADPAGGPAEVVARGAAVLALPRPSERTGADPLQAGALVVVGVLPGQALELASATVSRLLSVIFTG